MPLEDEKNYTTFPDNEIIKIGPVRIYKNYGFILKAQWDLGILYKDIINSSDRYNQLVTKLCSCKL
jgi:hypothetical protein